MLPTSSTKRQRRAASRLPRLSPHRLMRWLCLCVFVALLLFVFTLFRFQLMGRPEPLPVDVQQPPKPHRWESFPFLKRYHGGIRTLVPRKDNIPEYPGEGTPDDILGNGDATETAQETSEKIEPRNYEVNLTSSPFNPYPDYKSEEYIRKHGEKVECFLDEENTVRIPSLRSFPGVPSGFPDAVIGSNEMLGIQDDVCFDRFGRLGPYGLGYSIQKGGIGAGLTGHREGAEQVWEDVPPVDFRQVNWAAAQNRCLAANHHRFKESSESLPQSMFNLPLSTTQLQQEAPKPSKTKTKEKQGTDRLPRTAVLIRTWHDFHYTPEDILFLRSLITELSLASGGEYEVYFLVHVKDDNLQIWSDQETYERVLRDALPEEFRGMGVLWSERQMSLIYGGLEETMERGLPVHGVYRSTFMPVQFFSYNHPEYDYIWNWEMDCRYTGNWYHLFEKVVEWARQQPRKGLWERNARFYVPSEHGSWEDFKQTVRVQTEMGTNSPNNLWSARPKDSDELLKSGHEDLNAPRGEKFIWGPERPHDDDILEVEGEGIPPTTIAKDKYEWGVGEEADLIVFNPLYDPEGTTWLLRNDVTGYNREDGLPPRRAAIITASRLSKKLLHTMHRETVVKRHTMFSEMWPATTCLHHGFKAVSVPHSIYIDRRWPTKYLESTFNAGRNGASGGARTAIFGDREHNFRGVTWFYSAGFSPNLYRRWLGFKVDNDGGDEEELAGEGRMCLPPMLLHPIKQVELDIDDGVSE